MILSKANPKLQALRIEAGWNTIYNQFTEQDLNKVYHRRTKEYCLLMICNDERGKMINLHWKSNGNADGEYKLLALNYLETFNSTTNTFEMQVDSENPYAKIISKDTNEIIKMIEQWLTELPITHDARILKKRGETDEPSETYRKELLKNGFSDQLAHLIMSNGNQKIQDLLLEHSEMNKLLIKS